MSQNWPGQEVTPSAAPADPARVGGFIPAPGYEEEQARKAQADAIAAEEAARKRVVFDQEQADRALRGGAPTTESEKTAAFLATRVANGIRALNSIEGGESPEVLGSVVGAISQTAGNYVTSEARQRVEAAQRDILDAALTLGTGAAYTAEQLEGYRRSYFPQLGDAEATIADKQQRLNALLEAAKVKAGAAAPAIDEALAAVASPAPQGGNGQPIPDDGVLRGRVTDTSAFDARVMAEADRLEQQLGETGLMELAAQGITLGLSDEAGGAGRAIGQALTGDFNVGENYSFGVEVERELLRRARERTGGFGTAAELIGSGGAVRTIGNAALNAGRALAGAGQPVTRGAIQSRIARDAAVDGAIVGGTAGFGYGEGAEESLTGAATGAAGGAALSSIFQRIANRRGGGSGSSGTGTGTGTGGNAPTTPGGQVIQAADNFNAATGANVQPLPADTGGAITRRASGAVAQTTFGARPIVEGAQAVNDEARAGIRTLAGRQGDIPQSRQAGGEAAIRGAEKTMQRAKLKVDALYTKARKEAGDAEVELPMASTVLDSHIAELSRVPGGGEGLSTLQALASDIKGKRFPVDGIKAMRTQLRDKFLKEGLRGSDVERRVNDVIDAAELDIEDGLLALGKPDAARAYASASKAAAERFTLIDDVLAPVLGKRGEKSGEQAFAAIDQLSRGDAVTLGKFMRALPDEEAGSVRGLIIDRLGRASKGRQDADGQAFSLNDFLTRWNDEGLSKEAKAVLFDGETIAALDDLARVAQGTKEGQRFANFSNTGGANFLNFFLNGAPLGAVAGGVLPAAGAAGVSVGAQFGLGRLLASPKFARWLAKMPKQNNPAAARKHIMGLERIAAADAAIAADALGLQRQLLATFDQGAVPLAAQDQAAGSNTTGSETQ